MRKINFKKMKAQNFLCFGNEGIEIDFHNHGNVVLIKGKNLDIKDGDLHSSNGSGKSSILDALIYGLYGKTVKNPKKIGVKDVINNKTNKKMSIEIYFDDIKISRTRKPDGLKLWQSSDGIFDESTELTRGEIKQTQELIESILGFSYETFKSICVFTDSNTDSYLESNAAERRIIVENLLGLEKYRNYHETSKEMIKSVKQEITLADIETKNNITNYNSYKLQLDQLEEKEKKWKELLLEEIKVLKSDIELLEKQQKDLADFDPQVEKYNKAQNEIINKNNEIESLEEKITKAETNKDQIDTKLEQGKNLMLEKAKEQLDIKSALDEIDKDIKRNKIIISNTEKLKDGVECSVCYSTISKENYENVKNHCLDENNDLSSKHKEKSEELTKIADEIAKIKTSLQAVLDIRNKVVASISSNKTKISELKKDLQDLEKIEKPETINMISKIKDKISVKNITIMEKEVSLNTKSPYSELILNSKTNLEQYKEQKENSEKKLSELNAKIPYLNFWSEAFGDKGVRRFVIDQILPILNDHVQQMLDLLVDGNLCLTFDNEFNETIKKITDESPIIYDLLSNGQKRRINLAISQAFAHVRELNTGTMPDIIFLDEISINMDSQGNNSIYKLIKEIAKYKTVFVTTHDQELTELLSESGKIQLKMENGTSTIAS